MKGNWEKGDWEIGKFEDRCHSISKFPNSKISRLLHPFPSVKTKSPKRMGLFFEVAAKIFNLH